MLERMVSKANKIHPSTQSYQVLSSAHMVVLTLYLGARLLKLMDGTCVTITETKLSKG